MRPRVCLVVICSVLFMNTERAIDLLYAGQLHSDQHTYGVDPSATDRPAEDGDAENDATECGHCLHGHLASIFAQDAVASIFEHDESAEAVPATLTGFLRAPPTPPPNA